MENTKLIAISEYNGVFRTEEAIVEKETSKQFKLKNTSRRILNKSDIGIPLPYGLMFAYEYDVKRLISEELEKRVRSVNKTIENKTNELYNLEKSRERFGLI
jgi:hypothetical protein